ncbi:MAG: hypothetical protein D3904_16970 [Candidatus Electrothrix sp. EH2]|nr:hypothetical protein [Candidatus Electrothrix sp. EH2]
MFSESENNKASASVSLPLQQIAGRPYLTMNTDITGGKKQALFSAKYRRSSSGTKKSGYAGRTTASEYCCFLLRSSWSNTPLLAAYFQKHFGLIPRPLGRDGSLSPL